MNIKLNERQLTLIILNLLVVKMIFIFTGYLFKTSGNAAWLEAIYITAAAFVLLELSFAFCKYTGCNSIIRISESVGGQFFKTITAFLVFAVLFVNVSTEMRTFSESVKIILLPDLKTEYIMILFAIAVGIGSCCGITAVATVNALYLPVCLFFLGVLGIMLIADYNVNNILPIFGTGAKNIFVGGIADISCFGDIIALNLLLPYCDDIKTAQKCGRKAVLTGGIILMLLCLAYGLIYPYPYSADFLLTAYQMSRMVRIGEYFQRFEAFFELVWAIMQLLYSSIYIFLICDTFSKTFKLKNYKIIVPCSIIITVTASLEPSSVAEFLDISGRFRKAVSPIAFALPIVVPLMYKMLKRKKR